MNDPSSVPFEHPEGTLSEVERVPGPSAVEPKRPKLRLEAQLSFADAGRKVLTFHFQKALANEAATIEGSDPEALHDMRVAIRRLRAAFRIFRQALGKETVKPLASEARWVGHMLGRVRDLDVFLDWLHSYRELLAEERRATIDRTISEVESARNQERVALLEALHSDRYDQWKRAMVDLTQTAPAALGHLRLVRGEELPAILDPQLETQIFAPDEELLVERASRRIRRQFKKARKFGKKVDEESFEQLHELRIACKRARYTAEFFRTLYPDRLKEFIEVCVTIQDALGAIRDAHVQSEFLRGLLKRYSRDIPMRMSLLQMLRALRRRQRQQHSIFEDAWKQFASRKFRRALKVAVKEPGDRSAQSVEAGEQEA